MKTLRRIAAIARKEILEHITSPFLLMLETLFLVLAGSFFFFGVEYYSQASQVWLENPALQQETLNVTAFLLPPVFTNYALLLLFFVPVLTMTSFAAERRSGTLELLFTFPVRDLEIICGKWLGTSSILTLLLLPLWGYPFVLRLVGSPLALDTYGAAFLGLVLLAVLFVAVGLFISSLFESQTTAAVLTSGLLVLLWSLDPGQSIKTVWVRELLSRLALQHYYQPFLRGLISLEGILFFVLATTFFVFLTFRALERRSLRGAS